MAQDRIVIPESVKKRLGAQAGEGPAAEGQSDRWAPGRPINVPDSVRARIEARRPPPPAPPPPGLGERIATWASDKLKPGEKDAPPAADLVAFPMGRGLADAMRPAPASEAGAGRGFVNPPPAGVELDPNARELSMRQLGQDFEAGVETVKMIGEGAKAFPSAASWGFAARALQDMDAIDAGQNPAAGPSTLGASKVHPYTEAYLGADPQRRTAIRNKVNEVLLRDEGFVQDSVKAIQAYSATIQKLTGKMPEFTDIRSVRDFGVWLARNGVNTTPTLLASMVGAAFGPLGLGVTSGAMAVGDLTSGRAQHISGLTDPKRMGTADRMVDAADSQARDQTRHIAAAVPNITALAPVYMAGDFIGPAGTLARGGVHSAATTAGGAALDAMKRLPGDVVEEFVGEGPIQEGANIAAEYAAGERTGGLTGEDAKRIINAGAAGAAGAPVGTVANAGIAAGRKAMEPTPEQRIARTIDQNADLWGKYFAPKAAAPMPPTQAREASVKRFDELAAAFGLNPKAAAKVREQAGTMAASEAPGFLARVTRSLNQRGMFKRPVDDAGIGELGQVMDQVEAPEGEAKAPAAAPAPAAPPADEGDFTGLDTPQGEKPATLPAFAEAPPVVVGTNEAGTPVIDDGRGHLRTPDGKFAPEPANPVQEPSNEPVSNVAAPAVAPSVAPAGRGPDAGRGVGAVGSDAGDAAGRGNGDPAAPVAGAGPAQPVAAAGGVDAALTPPAGPRVIGRVGRTPKAAEDVDVRPNADGTLTPYMGGQPLLDYDSAEPIVVPAESTDREIADAIERAGAIGGKSKFFGVADDPAPDAAAPGTATPSASPSAAAPGAAAPSVAPAVESPTAFKPRAGESLKLDGKDWTVDKVTPKAVTLTGADGKKKRIEPDSPTWKKLVAQNPVAPSQTLAEIVASAPDAAATPAQPAVDAESAAPAPAAAPGAKPRLAKAPDTLLGKLKMLAGGYVDSGGGRGILPVYARNPAGGPTYAVGPGGKVTVIEDGGRATRDATAAEVNEFHNDLEADRLWVHAYSRWGGSGGDKATSSRPLVELHSPSGLSWKGKTAPPASPVADELRAFRERRAAQRAAERADAAAAKAQEAAEAKRREQEEMDQLAQAELEKLQPVIDSPPPSQTSGPLTEEDLSAIFDEAAAELREETQEQPDVPPPGEPGPRPVPADAPAPAPTADEEPTFTEAQARKQFEWRDLGQKDGTKTHALFFYVRPEDKGTGRAMGYGNVQFFQGSSGWKVDGEGNPFKSLADAKRAAIEVALPKVRDNGWIVGDATPATLPSSTRAESTDSEAVRKAKADLMAGLGDLASLLSKPGRMNITPEQEQRLLPILTKVMDAAFRLGYLKFKDAARFVLDQIRAAIGDDVANAITLDHLQGSYIGMAGKYRDQGAERAAAVATVESLDEITAPSAETLPTGWTEATPGGMATNPDPAAGGIVDRQIASGQWFAVPAGGGAATLEGFATRADAIKALRAAAVADNQDQEAPDVPSTDSNLEPDRQDAEADQPPVGEPVQGDGPADGAEAAGGRAGSAGRGRPDDQGVPAGGAPAARIPGDQPVRGEDRADGPTEFDAGTDDGERSDDPGFPGIQPDLIPAEVVASAAARPTALEVKRLKQRAAERIPVKPGDIDNIRETLPYLTEAQQDDVLKTEQRFGKPDGYGMLFTNGTGTGKTFTGLGAVKRFQRQGKTNALIVVPDEKIMSDWVEAGKPLGLTITPLLNSKDAGRGITITTYANLGMNDALASREWDLVVPDEAHSLKQAADAKDTLALDKLRAITLHPRGILERFSMLHRDEIAERSRLAEQIEANNKLANRDDTMDVMVDSLRAENAKLQAAYDKLNAKLEADRERITADVQARQGAARTRLLALSATPFAYEGTVDWAEGYLFDYGPEPQGGGYNTPSAAGAFMIQHFGYRMRTGKLNKPDAKVDSGLMQRQFNTWLKKQGVLSGRMLEVGADYDRKFVLVDSAVGNQIDRAMQYIREQSEALRKADKGAVDGWAMLNTQLDDALYGKLGHLTRRYLLEAIKAKEVVPIVRAHLALGRKVVVFHDFKQGGSMNPFGFQEATLPPRAQTSMTQAEYDDAAKKYEAMNAAVLQFRKEFPDLSGNLLSDLISPVTRFTREFPDVLLINGDQKKADLLARYKRFNDDAAGPTVMLVQSDKNKGWSGHDTTGKYPRVLINLGLPTQPTKTIQTEGRIYRYGQFSNAMFRYLNTGTNWERWAFAQTIAERASAAENLATGEQARALKDAYIRGFEESDAYPPGHEGEGTGGKEADRAANDAISEYDRARAFYWGTQKKTSRTKAQEGADYFATPEPVGLKMTQWLDLRPGEASLEPSGGHGAIARWLNENTERTAIEPSTVLGSRLALVFDGKIVQGTFENHNVVNKYDGIAMNPPFGTAGRMAIDHLAKAATHLRDGGRIVALIPTGPSADAKFDKWFYEEDTRPAKPLGTMSIGGMENTIYAGDSIKSNRFEGGGIVTDVRDGKVFAKQPGATHATGYLPSQIDGVARTGPRTESYSPAAGLSLVADIKLPGVTFERAGAGVMTRIVVIEKPGKGRQAPQQINRDYTDIADINELFDALETLDLSPRAKPAEDAAAPAPAQTAKAEKAQAQAEGAAQAADAGLPIVEHTTGKGKLLKGVVRTDLSLFQAKEVDPFTFKKNGGYFIRLEHLAVMNEKFPPGGANPTFNRSGDGYTQFGDAQTGTDDADPDALARIGVLDRAIGRHVGDASVHPYVARVVPGDEAIRSVANALGTRVQWFGLREVLTPAERRKFGFFNGVYYDGTIYLRDAGGDRPHLAVLGHELVHRMKATRPTLYKRFLEEVRPFVDQARYAEFVRTSSVVKDVKGADAIREEFLGEVMADAFMDRGFWRSLADKNPSVFGRVVKMLHQLIDAVLKAVGYTPRTERILTDYRRVMDIAADVMAEYADAGGQEAASELRFAAQGAAPHPVLAALSNFDRLFKLPRPTGKSINEIAFDVDPAIKVLRVEPVTGQSARWRLDMPDGGHAYVAVRKPNPYGSTLYGFDLDDEGEMVNVVTERPGKNPDDVPPDTQDVILDVSKMKTGTGGDKAYLIAGALAHNTGRIFIGDPAGLTDAALRRRSEQMLSMALKYGTTQFLAPHPYQVRGSKKLGVPPLEWVYGDDAGNVERLIALNVVAAENALPALSKLDFDVNTGQFVNTATGRPIPGDSVIGVGGRRRQEGVGAFQAAQAGGRTLARAAVLRAVLREARGTGEGRDGGRPDVLGILGRAAAGMPAELFYQRAVGDGEPGAAVDGGLPLFQRSNPNHTPEQTKALAKAGIAGPRSMREKVRAYYGAALQMVSDRNHLAEAAWTEFRQGALDQFHGIRRAEKRLLGNLPVEQSAYIAARLANGGTSSVMRALMLHGQARWTKDHQHLEKIPDTKGLLDILAPLGDDLNDWFGWMVGNRAERLLKEGRENNLTAADIKALKALATPDKLRKFQAAAIEYAAFKRSVLDVAQSAGLIDPEARKVWDHADYIPFYREIDEKATFSATGKGYRGVKGIRKSLSHQTSGIRKLKGGTAGLNDPMENLLMNFSRLIDASLKNNAILKTVRMIEQVKDQDTIKKVGYDFRPAIIPREQIRQTLVDAGTPPDVLDAMPEDVFDGMAKVWQIQQPNDPDVIRVMVGGKPKFYRVLDPLLLRSLTSFVPFDFPGLALMRQAKNVLTKLVTATPEFMVRNWIRDSVAAQAIARHGFSPAASVKGVAKAFSETGGFESMLFAGASFQTGQYSAHDPEAAAVAMRRALRSKGMKAGAVDDFMATVVDTPGRAWDFYRRAGEAIENANREAVYEAAIKAGGSETQAAYQAKDLMDFSLRGSWPAYQVLADTIVFLNARVQGMYRLGRSDPKRLWRVGAMLMVASLVLASFNDGEDWYEELPDWDKDLYWHMMIAGKHVRIPKPFEVGVFFATMPERIGRAIKGLDDGDKTMQRALSNARDQLAIDPVPQLIRPGLDVYANWDPFRRKPVENQSDEGKLPSARYSAVTSDTAKLVSGAVEPLSNAVGMSPKRIEYLIGGYFGTIGLYALGASDWMVRELQNAPERPTLRPDDIPLVRAFIRADPARGTVYESDLWAMRQEIEQIKRTILSEVKSGNVEGATKRLAENEAKLEAAGPVLGTVEALSEINKARDAIYADRDMTPAEKRAKLDELQRERNRLAREAATDPSVRAAF